MADVSRKHHTVPQFYLKGFATASRQIGTVQLPGTKRFVQSTSKASAHTDFYAVPGHEEGPDVFEKGLSRVEGEAARVIRRITEEHVWPLSPEDRELLAAFLTLQFLRGPEQRRHMEEMSALVTRMEVGYGGKPTSPHGLSGNMGSQSQRSKPRASGTRQLNLGDLPSASRLSGTSTRCCS
ncbi:DUF4238 domain-containing protein [Pseudarthrobacter sp. LMD1-1-1.1]|uniref:DUF4238 domain-containing protein n=1 Tax=Pseudarthrobacter sp. LMD1-1-1.1 TaxID=3135242 RepID=UPI00341A8B74